MLLISAAVVSIVVVVGFFFHTNNYIGVWRNVEHFICAVCIFGGLHCLILIHRQ